MRVTALLRRGRMSEDEVGVAGPARLGRRVVDLGGRLRAGDVVVLEQMDLDRASADVLVAAGVVAVVNAAPSTSGRYPNLGPQVLLDHGIALLDCVGVDVWGTVREGQVVRVHEDGLYAADGSALASGVGQTADTVAVALSQARSGLAAQLEAFAGDTIELLRREHDLLFEAAGLPDISAAVRGRPVVIVSAGYDYGRQLAALRHYLRDERPALIGVDAGADALLSAGHRPDLLVVGNPESVSDTALGCGADVVVQLGRPGAEVALARVQELGRSPRVFRAAVPAEDAAILMADKANTPAVVTVGMHRTLEEFLDKGTSMAGAFLARLRAGGRLVGAGIAAALHRPRRPWLRGVLLGVDLLVLIALAAGILLAGGSHAGFWQTEWRHLRYWVHHL
jgi:uncharacterized membrane-anchored protein